MTPLKRRDPGAGDRRRRLLGAVGEGQRVPAVPLRRRGVRARPGPQARGVPDERLDHRPGLLQFEGFTGHLPAKRGRDFQGWVQISAGCNMVCSYCIVPSTRRREVSRPLDELVAEVRGLAADGVREVTLLGQNVNSYGRSLRPRASFAELLYALDGIKGLDRIRYTSPHPSDMKEDVVRAHAELPSVCEHVHLPLQSGSSAVLKRMRRTYSRERFLDRVALIYSKLARLFPKRGVLQTFPHIAQPQWGGWHRLYWAHRGNDSKLPSKL